MRSSEGGKVRKNPQFEPVKPITFILLPIFNINPINSINLDIMEPRTSESRTLNLEPRTQNPEP